MKYDELKEMCHIAWNERFNYHCIDMTKNKNEGKYRIFNESKTTYIECICETEPFPKHLFLIRARTLICATIKNYSLTYSYKCMNKTVIAHIGVEHIHLSVNKHIHFLLYVVYD